jgi:hypothetical protein
MDNHTAGGWAKLIGAENVKEDAIRTKHLKPSLVDNKYTT